MDSRWIVDGYATIVLHNLNVHVSFHDTLKISHTFFNTYIDDIFLVQNEDQNSLNVFELFKSDLNKQCKLKRVTEDLSTETKFLDLTIQINRNKGKFLTRTYQKPLTLFLYIPAHSSHPPGLMKSLSTGLLETYWRQNSESHDYIKIAGLLYKRLLARGHKDVNIDEIF